MIAQWTYGVLRMQIVIRIDSQDAFNVVIGSENIKGTD